MKRTFLLTTAAAVLAGSIAMADAFTDQIVADLQGQGFTGIEIKNGINQIKVEAVRDDLKIEVIYDRSTGRILKQEQESAEGEDIAEGVSIRAENRDFVDGSDDEEDHEDDLEDDDDDHDDDDEDDEDDDDDDEEDDEDDDDDDDDDDDEDDEDDDDDDDEDDEDDEDEDDEDDEDEDED